MTLLDVDHFKRINDERGHLAGDEVLRALGPMISRCLRDGEYAGRYGGEEILLVLSDADGRAAERVLKLHLAIRHDTFRTPSGPICITCSIGVTWAGIEDSWESLVGRADAALYEAKHDGRDRVVENENRSPVLRLPAGD
ncbi:MAG: GGDEF domain-containing protein [Gluconacetobacter diazotrophicus]|nr:GGDEF domain-containing protein [Gluconacetobacter diazotrophicus]